MDNGLIHRVSIRMVSFRWFLIIIFLFIIGRSGLIVVKEGIPVAVLIKLARIDIKFSCIMQEEVAVLKVSHYRSKYLSFILHPAGIGGSVNLVQK